MHQFRKKLQPQISVIIKKNSIFGINRDPCQSVHTKGWLGWFLENFQISAPPLKNLNLKSSESKTTNHPSLKIFQKIIRICKQIAIIFLDLKDSPYEKKRAINVFGLKITPSPPLQLDVFQKNYLILNTESPLSKALYLLQQVTLGENPIFTWMNGF